MHFLPKSETRDAQISFQSVTIKFSELCECIGAHNKFTLFHRWWWLCKQAGMSDLFLYMQRFTNIPCKS